MLGQISLNQLNMSKMQELSKPCLITPYPTLLFLTGGMSLKDLNSSSDTRFSSTAMSITRMLALYSSNVFYALFSLTTVWW